MKNIKFSFLLLLPYLLLLGSYPLSIYAAYPTPPSYPTEVFVKLSLNGLRKIDAVDSTFITDYYIMMAWRDDRLYNEIGSTLDPTTNFHPTPEIINPADENSATEFTNLIISPDDLPGWVYRAPSVMNETWVLAIGRKIGSFTADLQLVEFPFDRQNASILMESSAYKSSELVWRLPDNIMDGLNEIEVGGWDNAGVNIQVINYTYPALEEDYSRLIISKLLIRQYGYYLSRVFSNVIILVIMAFAVAFVRATEPDRLGFVQACFLGVVSWLFVLNAEVPKVGYLTRLDAFTQTSFAVIFAQYLYHAIHWGYFKTYDRHLGRLTDDEKEHQEQEDIIDKCCAHCREHSLKLDKLDNASINTTEEELEAHEQAQHNNEKEDDTEEITSEENNNNPSLTKETIPVSPSASSKASKRTLTKSNSSSSTSNNKSTPTPSTNKKPLSPVKSPMSESANPIFVYIRNVKETTDATGIPISPTKPNNKSSSPNNKSKSRNCWQRWKDFNPHRQLDVLVTSIIALIYAIAVAYIVGQGISNTQVYNNNNAN